MPELLTFVETTVFTKRISVLGLEESLRRLQLELLENPEAGDVEPATSGLRKIRLGDPTRGKGRRGGKNEASSLTPEQKKQLREIVLQIKRAGDKETRA